MSELNNRDRNAYSKFEHMSTEDLETILRLDYQLPEGEGLDPDTILAITEVIANREKSESTPQYPDTDTAWNDFLTKYRPHGGSFLDTDADTVSKQEQSKSKSGDSPTVHRQRNVRWLMRTALVAAIIAVLLLATTVTASAFGYDLWDVIATWSKETFTFTTNGQADRSAPDTHQASASSNLEGTEYSSLQDALDGYGITAPLAPTWIPERFKLDSVTVGETSALIAFTAYYVNENQSLLIDITMYKSGSHSFGHWQKDDDNPVPYSVGEVTHYLMTNMDREKAVWQVGPYEGGISGDISREELILVLDSIYNEE